MQHRSTLACSGALALLCVTLVGAGCDGGDERDAGAAGDAGAPVDAGPGRDGGANDGGGVDAGAPAGPSGRVTFDRRPFTTAGLGPAVAEPAAGIVVVLLADGVEVERSATDDDGRYAFVAEPSGAVEVRALAELEAQPLTVSDFMDNVYAFTGPAGDLHVDEAELAGALAMLATHREGLAVAEEAFARSAPFPASNTYWERGRETPFGTSYALGLDLWILGGPNDTDEYDTSVLLHELGHYLQEVYVFSDVPDGDPHAGQSTDPRLAWNEGWPSFFSCLVRQTGVYGDTVDGVTALLEDLDALPTRGEYVGRPGRPQSQTLSEWLIAGSLWHLFGADPNRAQQLRRSFDPLTMWMDDPANDRAFMGRDFVDYLDGYACLSGDAQRTDVETYVVGERRFPYDLSPACPKPGRPMSALRIPEPVSLPGHIVFDLWGRGLHEIRLR